MHLDWQRGTSCMRTHTITALCACTREAEPDVVVRVRRCVRVDIGDGQVRAVVVPAATANRALHAPTHHTIAQQPTHTQAKDVTASHQNWISPFFYVRQQHTPLQCNALEYSFQASLYTLHRERHIVFLDQKWVLFLITIDRAIDQCAH